MTELLRPQCHGGGEQVVNGLLQPWKCAQMQCEINAFLSWAENYPKASRAKVFISEKWVPALRLLNMTDGTEAVKSASLSAFRDSILYLSVIPNYTVV